MPHEHYQRGTCPQSRPPRLTFVMSKSDAGPLPGFCPGYLNYHMLTHIPLISRGLRLPPRGPAAAPEPRENHFHPLPYLQPRQPPSCLPYKLPRLSPRLQLRHHVRSAQQSTSVANNHPAEVNMQRSRRGQSDAMALHQRERTTGHA